jgi:hypothetical protein
MTLCTSILVWPQQSVTVRGYVPRRWAQSNTSARSPPSPVRQTAVQGTNVTFSLGARLLLTAYFDSASKSACILIRPLVTTILFFQG